KKTMDFGDIEPDIAKSKHAPLHTHIPAKDSDLAEEAMEEERKKEKAQIWLLILFLIVFIWLGIAFSPYLYQLGDAVFPVKKEQQEDFYGYCLSQLDMQNTGLDIADQEYICRHGAALVFIDEVTEKDFSLQCKDISFEKDKKDRCIVILSEVLGEYKAQE
ncbi:MAG: hypothetical protein V1743_07720, partial [Nanoarchaeota archaeon]